MNTLNEIRKTLRQFVIRIYSIRIILLGAIPLIILLELLIPFRIQGSSMEPTYHNYTINFCWKGAYWFSTPKRFDVVLIKLDGNNNFLLKRVIGFAGEKIEFKDGVTFINDKKLDEPYLKLPWNWDMSPEIIKPNHIYIVGDNRNVKIHQHTFGEIPINRLYGRILW